MPASPTWTSTGCGPRSTSRPRSPASPGGSFRLPTTPSSGLAVTRAWNDWLYEAWWQPYPDRIIVGDHLPRRPRARGGGDPAERRARIPVGHPPRTPPPDRASQSLLGVLGPDHRRLRRDRHRRLAPCRVLGDAGHARRTRPLAGPRRHPVRPAVARGLCRVALVGLSGALSRLNIAMSEGGIGWVAMLLDRLDNIVERSG